MIFSIIDVEPGNQATPLPNPNLTYLIQHQGASTLWSSLPSPTINHQDPAQTAPHAIQNELETGVGRLNDGIILCDNCLRRKNKIKKKKMKIGHKLISFALK
jgi:hypothetical protein